MVSVTDNDLGIKGYRRYRGLFFPAKHIVRSQLNLKAALVEYEVSLNSLNLIAIQYYFSLKLLPLCFFPPTLALSPGTIARIKK